MCHSTADIKDERKKISIPVRGLIRYSPNTLSPPIFVNSREADIASYIYGKHDVFVNEKTEVNYWQVSIQRMLSLSDPGDIFFKVKGESDFSNLSAKNGWERLFSGKAIHAYNHRYAEFDAKKWQSVDGEALCLSDKITRTEYYVRAEELNKRLRDKKPNRWLLVYRDTTRATDERTCIATILPRAGCDTTFRNIYSNLAFEGSLFTCLIGILNSFPFDFLARQKVIGIHLGTGIIQQLPVISPQMHLETCLWGSNESNFEWLIYRILELVYTAWDLQPFAQDCSYEGPPFKWDEDRRFLLRCELDAAYFHLYGIQRDDVDYIMDTFPIVKRKDEKAHGHYRTKDTILEIYDAMASAIASGQPYQTLLDPPPADPSVAHPPRESGIGSSE